MRRLRATLVALSFMSAACPAATTTGQGNVHSDPLGNSGSPALSNEEAQALFQQAEAAYQARQYEKAAAAYKQLLFGSPGFNNADLAHYHLGMSLLSMHQPREALETIGPVFDRLPADEKPLAAGALSKAAVGTQNWGDAVRYLAEANRNADPAGQAELQARLIQLVDSDLPQLEVARLATVLQPDHPAYAIVMFKLARIAFHLHNWDLLKTTLETLQKNAPNHPFHAEAQALLVRVQKRDAVKPTAVGVLLPLSGKYQAFGEAALDGIKLALEGTGVELKVKDTAGEPDKAKAAVDELVFDGQVMALVGPIVSNEAQAAATEADELGVPIITLSRDEGLTSRGPYVFRNMLTNSLQARALVDYAVSVRGFKQFGMLYPNMPYGTELMNAFWDRVNEHGGEVTAAEVYDHDQTTYGPVVKKLVGRFYLEDRGDYQRERAMLNNAVKDAFKNRKAQSKLRSDISPIIDFQALFIPDQSKNVSLIAPALAVEDIVTNGCDARDVERISKTMGMKSPHDVKTVLLLGSNGWDSPELVERGGKFVQCSVFVDGFYAQSKRPETQKFVAAFTDANAKAPNLLNAFGYDTGVLVREVIGKGKPATRDAFRDGFLKLKAVPGATGQITVNARGEAERPLYFLTIDRNGIKEMDVQISGPEKENG